MDEVVLLDTSVLVDLLRGDGRAIGLIRSLPVTADAWSVTVVRTEILAGALPEDGESVRHVLAQLRWLPVDERLADLAGRMAAHYGPRHPGIALADYLVAAGTRLLGARLMTRNVRHYPMLAGLAPAYT